MSNRTTALTQELLALRGEDGLVYPREAVEWARRHKKSALHAQLLWDDTQAAEEYRVWQVRSLIAIHIVDAEGDRRLVSLSIDRVKDGGYRAIEDLAENVDFRQVMLNDALEELDRLQRKYSRLKELDRVWEAAEMARRAQKAADAVREVKKKAADRGSRSRTGAKGSRKGSTRYGGAGEARPG